jgi:hypothetical protein
MCQIYMWIKKNSAEFNADLEPLEMLLKKFVGIKK